MLTHFVRYAGKIPFSSSFTAINRPQDQLLTPESSATAPARQNQARRRAAGTARRRRNPTVAQYLGLGNVEEPAHLGKYAPIPDEPSSPPPKPARKPQKLGNVENIVDLMSTRSRRSNLTIQRRVSDGLRVTKPRGKPTARPKTSSANTVSSNDTFHEITQPAFGVVPDVRTSQNVPRFLVQNIAVRRTIRNRPSATCVEQTSGAETDDSNNNEFHDNDFELPEAASASIFDEEQFEDDLSDDEFLQLTSDMIDIGTVRSPLKSEVVQTQYPGSSANAPFIVDDGGDTRHRAKKFVSPITLTTRLLAATGDIERAEARKPIARPPFPTAVRDRSPIVGLSSNVLLRTCFRIGEVINQAHQAEKNGKHVTFELYARIRDSDRDEAKQQFTFCDLFHGKPPHLKGVYDAAVWKSVQLFNYDGKRLLQQGKIARCMGTMKREGKEWSMTVVNIWEATWDDIKWVEGIFNA